MWHHNPSPLPRCFCSFFSFSLSLSMCVSSSNIPRPLHHRGLLQTAQLPRSACHCADQAAGWAVKRIRNLGSALLENRWLCYIRPCKIVIYLEPQILLLKLSLQLGPKQHVNPWWKCLDSRGGSRLQGSKTSSRSKQVHKIQKLFVHFSGS